jgi:hypothetical protein
MMQWTDPGRAALECGPKLAVLLRPLQRAADDEASDFERSVDGEA